MTGGRASTVTAVTAIVLSLIVGGVLASVLIDPQHWFGDDFAAKETPQPTASIEKTYATAAAVEHATAAADDAHGVVTACQAHYYGWDWRCFRKVVGAEQRAPGLWQVVLARRGYQNWCVNVHLTGSKGTVVTVPCKGGSLGQPILR